MLTVRPATFPEDAAGVLDIWREYVASPEADLGYQDYEAELSDIPGKYVAPFGAILLGEDSTVLLGCIAMRKVTSEICEMKRLYVRPNARRSGLGRKLVEQLMVEARRSGYEEIRLDVLEEFKFAQALYAKLGFIPTAPISFNPTPGAHFLGLKL